MSSLVESLSMLNKVPEMLDVSDDVMMMSYDVTRTQAIQKRMLQELILIIEKASIRITQL